MRVLVTGAAGMIGRKLVAKLAERPTIRGQAITALDLHDIVPAEPPLAGGAEVTTHTGDLAGRILAGEDARYDTVSSFFSEVFGTSLKVFGDTTRFDEAREQGSLADGLLVGYGEAGRLVGALTVGQSEATEARAKELIAVGRAEADKALDAAGY